MPRKVSSADKPIKKKSAKPRVQKETGVKKTRRATKPNPQADIHALQQELKQRTDELAILNSVGEAMAKTLDVKTVVKIVGDKVQNIFASESVTIRLYDPVINRVMRVYDYDQGYQDLTDSSFELGKGLTSKIIKSGKPLLFGTGQEAEDAGSINVPNPAIQNQTEAFMGVPIFAGAEVIGAVSVQSYKQHTYDENHLRLLETLASNMGVAIQNARLFEAEQERVAELQIINSIQQGLAAELDFQAIVDLVGDKLSEVLNTGDLGINWYDEKTNLVHYLYTFEHGERLSISSRHPTPGGQFETIRKTRQPVVWNTQAEYIGGTVDGTDQSKSLVAIPIISSDRVLGTISIENYERENAFGESELRLLTTIAASLGTALENARLFAETQRLFKAEQERVAELQIINSIQQGLAAELDFQAIVDLVGDKLREVFNTADFGIRWYDEKTNLVHFMYEYEHGNRLNIEPQEPKPGGTFDLFLTDRQPIIGNTAEIQARTGGTTLPGTDQSKSMISVPIISSDHLIGSLQIENYEQENAYGESELRLLTTIAASLGTALENARLFDETQRLLKITEDRAAELAIINSVQEGLASKLEMQAIYDLIGDKLSEVLHTHDIDIRLFDVPAGKTYFPYVKDNGKRITLEPAIFRGMSKHVYDTKQTVVVNQDLPGYMAKIGSQLLPGTQMEKSFIGLPITSGGNVVGMVGISDYEKENAFQESQVRLLQTVVSSMSVALENARLFDETQRLLQETEERAKELVIINGVQADLSSSMETQAMYQLVGDKIQQVFDAQVVTIIEYDPQVDRNIWRYAVEKGEPLTIAPSQPLGFSRHIINTRQMILVNENLAERRRELGGAIAAGQPAQSYLGVPLLINNEVRGIISLQNVDHENAFSESDVRLLQTLASSMSVALENARLLEETRRRERENIALLDISRDISASLNSSTVLEGIASHAKNVLRADLSGLFLPEENGQVFRAIAAVGEEAQNLLNDTIQPGEGILGSIAQNKIGEIVNDVEHDSRGVQIAGTDINPDEHLLAVPLLANEELKGLMAVWRNGKNNEFLDSELEFLSGLSRQAVIAVQNAQLFDEAREARTAAEDANRAKSAFLATMSHELRTPLNAIIGFTRIVRRKAEDLPEKQKDNLDKVLSSAEHLLDLINTVLDIAKIEAGRMDVQASNFSINALVDQCFNTAQPLIKPNVRFEKQNDNTLPLIYSDQNKIKQIVLNLLSNAAKFTHEGNIKISVRHEKSILKIDVQDTGIGMNQEALGRIFEEFQQADSSTTRQYGGTGLGLSISRSLARLLGGDLDVTSEAGQGSTFTLTIPIHYEGKISATLSDVQPDSAQSTFASSQTNP